ncbi:MAG: hypothetical protein VYB55_04085 [Bacteroidota bacterium]|nr:hypothetical protein [Bacteroidota bacterium]
MSSTKIKTIKELCEYIWFLEEKYDLFNLEINGIHPWAAFRMDLYYTIGKKFGVFDKNLNMKLTTIEKTTNFFRLLKNSIINHSSLNLKKVDALIFSWERSQMVEGKLIDPYTFYLKEDLSKQKISFIEFESPYKGKHRRKKEYYKRYLDSILILRNIKNIFIKTLISAKSKQIITQLSNDINQKGDNFLDVKQILINNTKKFKPTYSFYLNILKKTQPQRIYLVVSYGRGELIKAANDLNIEIIELQHGTFSKYHLGYSFPNNSNKLYLPTKFYVWNKYWKDLMDFAIPKKDIAILPFQNLENEKKKHNLNHKKQNSLIVLGQGGLTENIADKIIQNISYFRKYNITFKLHPNEYHMIRKYKRLNYLKKTHNVKVVTNVDLYRALALSEYQAGVFSTVLYEVIEFNCKTILLDLPGIEYMDQFIKKYNPTII